MTDNSACNPQLHLSHKFHESSYTYILKGSLVSRSQSDVVRMLSPSFGDQIKDKIVSERNLSNKKANGTPMKMLIAQEMSKEAEFKRNPPNMVAKLMGLDALPRQHHNLAEQRCHSKGSSRHSSFHSEIPVENWERDQGFSDKVNLCAELNQYKDVYEIWQQSPRTTYRRDSSTQKGRNNDNGNESKMALVRQKFMEAKHLVTDEKLRQTKEFQDALEVLSSNKELFLKLMEEPNSTFSQHLYSLHSLPLSRETKRITVLRPSKMVDREKYAGTGKKGDNQTRKPLQMGQLNGWDRNSSACSPSFSSPKVDEYPSQPTRIVVLESSPGKTREIKTVASPAPSSPRIFDGEDLSEEAEDDDVRESRDAAREITRHMRENLMGHTRKETLLSSVLSNGYNGDDSSCNRSENEYAVENLSDSEVISPTSRHSWDYVNRFGSPYSASSFSRASCSPESSVCREAKKRLSERWAMIASSGNSQEQRHVRRSSSTLGEMLALSDTKKSLRSEEEGSNKEQEARGSTPCVTNNSNKEEESTSDSAKNLLRSKSVPVSSTVYGGRLNVEVSDPEARKEQVSKELTKAKSMKSTLKGKVSSLFFSKNKKTNKEKSSGAQSIDESPATPGTPGSPVIHPQKTSNDVSQCITDSGNQDCSSPVIGGSTSITASPDFTGMGQKRGIISMEGGLSITKPSIPVHISENQDQPSPISVLEPPCDEDENTFSESSCGIRPVPQGFAVPPKSNLIDKSPPIELVARTISWDDSCSEMATLYPSKTSSVSPGAREDEQDWVYSVQSLLSTAGLDGEVQFESFIAGWYSPESPLDPSMREKYANVNDKEPLHESKRRQWRSNRKLVFDCVNAALLEIMGYASDSCMRAMSMSRAQTRVTEGAPPMMVDHVWARMKEWFCNEVKCSVGYDGDCSSLVVERVVQKEVVGKAWADGMKLEMDNFGIEIVGMLLEELMQEAVVDFTDMVL